MQFPLPNSFPYLSFHPKFKFKLLVVMVAFADKKNQKKKAFGKKGGEAEYHAFTETSLTNEKFLRGYYSGKRSKKRTF